MLKKYSGNILTNCFTKDRETRRKDKWEKTKNFFFDLGTKNKKAANHLSHRDSRRPLKTYNY